MVTVCLTVEQVSIVWINLLTFALVGVLRRGPPPHPVPVIGEAVLAVHAGSAVLAQTHWRAVLILQKTKVLLLTFSSHLVLITAHFCLLLLNSASHCSPLTITA